MYSNAGVDARRVFPIGRIVMMTLDAFSGNGGLGGDVDNIG